MEDLGSRREFFVDAFVGGSSLLLASATGFAQDSPKKRGEKLVRTLRFHRRGRQLEKVYGEEWHGRFLQDLSLLDKKTLITPNERFYIRTRCPKNLPDPAKWRIAMRKADGDETGLAAKKLLERSKPMGVHLLECSGNGGSFGLISAAAWSGVPLIDVLDESGLKGDYVLVDGFDEHESLPKNTLQAGCSWIFRREDLQKAGAFLATGMNGVPLPPDHGHPVRLIVPGWYGCTCVKWVQSIEIADEKAKSTRHMREYSSRTHQKGSPRRARDFRPATIDTAALPIRVEEWRKGEDSYYRITGIVWGGDKPVKRLDIHIGEEPVVPVTDFEHESHRTWSLWTHTWKPTRDGRFDMWLTCPDDKIRTRRLDRRYYRRRLRI